VSLLDFERVEEIAAEGYRASVDVVAEWASSRTWLGALA
jgi:hypothetical protein